MKGKGDKRTYILQRKGENFNKRKSIISPMLFAATNKMIRNVDSARKGSGSKGSGGNIF